MYTLTLTVHSQALNTTHRVYSDECVWPGFKMSDTQRLILVKSNFTQKDNKTVW